MSRASAAERKCLLMIEMEASTATKKVMVTVLHSVGSRQRPDVRRLLRSVEFTHSHDTVQQKRGLSSQEPAECCCQKWV